ncbi:MAG: hypothetical protein OEZ01_11935 [Candidatus Heimdallarchaeota archaeon]|nr:hypothetical protein [Candidatus Heimdallarchaeota archaeon]
MHTRMASVPQYFAATNFKGSELARLVLQDFNMMILSVNLLAMRKIEFFLLSIYRKKYSCSTTDTHCHDDVSQFMCDIITTGLLLGVVCRKRNDSCCDAKKYALLSDEANFIDALRASLFREKKSHAEYLEQLKEVIGEHYQDNLSLFSTAQDKDNFKRQFNIIYRFIGQLINIEALKFTTQRTYLNSVSSCAVADLDELGNLKVQLQQSIKERRKNANATDDELQFNETNGGMLNFQHSRIYLYHGAVGNAIL